MTGVINFFFNTAGRINHLGDAKADVRHFIELCPFSTVGFHITLEWPDTALQIEMPERFVLNRQPLQHGVIYGFARRWRLNMKRELRILLPSAQHPFNFPARYHCIEIAVFIGLHCDDVVTPAG